jgi:hypothetical protein
VSSPTPYLVPSDTASATTIGGAPRRRAVPRSPHRVPCRLTVLEAPGRERSAACGETVNVSSTGVAVQLGWPIPCGTEVEVLIPHLEDDLIHVLGTVVHSRRVMTGTFEIGIRRERERDPLWP